MEKLASIVVHWATAFGPWQQIPQHEALWFKDQFQSGQMRKTNEV